MATISSIVPDADGDLHDASLHNQKFNTILNEINGNIDADNLKYPDAMQTWSFSCSFLDAQILDGINIVRLPTITAAGFDSNLSFDVTNGANHTLPSSYTRADRAYTVTGYNMLIVASPDNVSGENFTVTFEKATDLAFSSGVTTLASIANDFEVTGANYVPENPTMSSSNTAIAANDYVRVRVTNPSSWSAGTKAVPIFTLKVFLKAAHV
jgi:hypothetical protein